VRSSYKQQQKGFRSDTKLQLKHTRNHLTDAYTILTDFKTLDLCYLLLKSSSNGELVCADFLSNLQFCLPFVCQNGTKLAPFSFNKTTAVQLLKKKTKNEKKKQGKCQIFYHRITTFW
jgi:hypothetical protein